MWTGDTFSKLPEEGYHNLCELSGLDDVKDLFQFVQIHDLKAAIGNNLVPSQCHQQIKCP